MTLYKVLVGGKSCHGGDLVWSLPTHAADGSWTPGDWHEVTGEIVLCDNGLHLTAEPARWWQDGAACYEAEHEGDTDGDATDGDRKIAVRRARLLRAMTDAGELAALRIFTEGMHSVSEGVAWASGSASVQASGSASVEASGSASVRAYDSASVRAYDSASVEAYGSASVRASDSASVEAYGSASVRAYDSASVQAYGSASVRAYDSASVETRDAWGAPTVAVMGYAVWIDRRNGAPVVHAVTAPEIVTHPGEEAAS